MEEGYNMRKLLFLWSLLFCLGGMSQNKNHSLLSLKKIEMPKIEKKDEKCIVQYLGYTAFYNPIFKTSNWVAYELTKDKTNGTHTRDGMKYHLDTILSLPMAVNKDYSGIAPYCRGHLVPAGDMKWSEQAMSDAFLTLNICPQNRDLNNGQWEHLESFVRWLAKRDGVVYICCGCITKDNNNTIGKNKIAIPAQLFKVICCQHEGKWQAIGFVFPNEECNGSIFNYAKTVDEVETITGYDFFHNLPDEIEKEIESEYDRKRWN